MKFQIPKVKYKFPIWNFILQKSNLNFLEGLIEEIQE
jgi:hypothetical protein